MNTVSICCIRKTKTQSVTLRKEVEFSLQWSLVVKQRRKYWIQTILKFHKIDFLRYDRRQCQRQSFSSLDILRKTSALNWEFVTQTLAFNEFRSFCRQEFATMLIILTLETNAETTTMAAFFMNIKSYLHSIFLAIDAELNMRQVKHALSSTLLYINKQTSQQSSKFQTKSCTLLNFD